MRYLNLGAETAWQLYRIRYTDEASIANCLARSCLDGIAMSTMHAQPQHPEMKKMIISC
jgi:hypothetical protein